MFNQFPVAVSAIETTEGSDGNEDHSTNTANGNYEVAETVILYCSEVAELATVVASTSETAMPVRPVSN